MLQKHILFFSFRLQWGEKGGKMGSFVEPPYFFRAGKEIPNNTMLSMLLFF